MYDKIKIDDKTMFSVLISTYIGTNAKFLEQSLESIFHQTILPDEVVIVKDGKINKEVGALLDKYARRFNQIRLISLEENHGLGYALNKGITQCSNELIARMDDDDIAKPERFEKQLECFGNDPDLDICSATVDEFEDDINNVISHRILPEFNDEIVKYAKKRCPINHPTVMYKKSKVIKAGNYQTAYLLEDYDLWMRMIDIGCKFYNIQDSLLYFRSNKNMYKRRKGLKYLLSELRLQYRFFKKGYVSLWQFILNCSIRACIRLSPTFIVSFIYKRFLR